MDILKKAGEIEKAAEKMVFPKDEPQEGGILDELISQTENAAEVLLDLDRADNAGEGKLDKLIHEVEEAAETMLDLDK